jgi:hypothetical protein
MNNLMGFPAVHEFEKRYGPVRPDPSK